jgi:hypothetical protein
MRETREKFLVDLVHSESAKGAKSFWFIWFIWLIWFTQQARNA